MMQEIWLDNHIKTAEQAAEWMDIFGQRESIILVDSGLLWCNRIVVHKGCKPDAVEKRQALTGDTK
jgi:hypothetical protein